MTIGAEVFDYDSALTSIKLGPNVAADAVTSGYAETTALTGVEVDPANPNYESIDGVLYSKDHSRLILYPAAKNTGGSYTVLDGGREHRAQGLPEGGHHHRGAAR